MTQSPNSLEELAELVLDNKIGIFPCDTIWGIIGLANETVAKNILSIKKRSSQKGFIHLINSYDQLQTLIDKPLNFEQHNMCNHYWPGAISFIFNKNPNISSLQTGKQQSIAIRMPQFAPLNALQTFIKQPLLSSSVNISAETAGRLETFNPLILDQIDFCYTHILPPEEQSSTVVDIRTKPFSILRQGSVKLTKF